jgi:tetratricopeptide (TPR) repeat protein
VLQVFAAVIATATGTFMFPLFPVQYAASGRPMFILVSSVQPIAMQLQERSFAMQQTTRSLILGLILAALCVPMLASTLQAQETPGTPADQQSRLALMKSRGIDGSVTILPVMLAGRPFVRVSEIAGLLLEQQGLKTIEIGQREFVSDGRVPLDKLSHSLGDFIAKNAVTTEYALYAEYNGTPQTGLDEMRAIVVDKKGDVVWTDQVGAGDEAFKEVQGGDPMVFTMFLVRRLSPQMGLTAETARAAKPGKMAKLGEERSGLPPENERAALPARLKEMRAARKNLTLKVFPIRRVNTTDAAGASELAKMITDAGLCKAVPAKESLLLKASQAEQNEMKILWSLAKEFREHARTFSPKDAYTLYADYVFNPEQWQQGFVHFVLCDPQGEWVVADLANSHHPDYQAIQPTSVEKCNRLVLGRLQGYLKLSVADAVREAIHSSGLDAARPKFDEVRKQKEDYNVSEQEMNELGYQYLQARKLKEAIAVFQMNVDAFPYSFNVYDSLGEAYAAAGDKELAIKNYEKSVELNPNSQSGIEALKRLRAK